MTTNNPRPGKRISQQINDSTVIDRDDIRHVYDQVVDIVAARIEAGRYTAKLPSERALSDEFGVSYITVRHGIAVLRERGLIVSIHGRGTFVASHFRKDHKPPEESGEKLAGSGAEVPRLKPDAAPGC